MNQNSFESMQTNSIHFKMPADLSTDLQVKLQKLNAAMDTIVFELNIRQIYPSLKAFKKQIRKIEIQIYHSIVSLRVIRQLKMIVFFNDTFFTIECPIILLDEAAQMEIIRKYMENRKHLNILEVDSEVSNYLKDYNYGDSIQFILKKNSIEISSNSQKQKTNLELNSGFLLTYKFDEFSQTYPNQNTINIQPNVLTPFQGYGFQMSITKDPSAKPRLFISQEWNNQIIMVLKSTTTLNNKIKFISILDDDSNVDELFDIIQEYNKNHQTEQQESLNDSVQEQQLRKKVKMHVID